MQLQAREQALIAQQREEASLLNSFSHQSGEQQSFSQTVVRELALAIKVRIYVLMTFEIKYNALLRNI